jgi:glutathione S-transferase
MILIGQYDSPFVRRVAIALRLYEMPFDHRPWSVFRDAVRVGEVNPLGRVPALMLDDGEVLIDSAAILDHLDEQAGPARALIARSGPARRRALHLCALASGVAEKAVALVYERATHTTVSPVLTARLHGQIATTLAALDTEAAPLADAPIGHAAIMLASALRFTGESSPSLLPPGRYPTLDAHAARCEALPVFAEIAQPFDGPRG